MTIALAVAVAAVLEAAVGEPPTRLHPVAWFGSVIAPVDREWRRPLVVGIVAATVLPLAAAAATGLAVFGVASRWPLAGTLIAGVVLFLTTSLRMLLSAARAVVEDSATDVEAARDGLLALAGRDASRLSPALLRSAAVESAAENLADGLVAALGAFALAGVLASLVGLPPLAVAAGAAVWVKAVNTMDSMLGYREKRVGTPAARLDDAVMWLPARAGAVMLALVAVDPGALRRARTWLGAVPSPNSGWPMATLAAALDVRLEKPGVYVLNDAAALPSVAAARRGVKQVALAGVLSYVLAGAVSYAAREVTVWS